MTRVRFLFLLLYSVLAETVISTDLWLRRSRWRLEIQFQGLAEIVQRFLRCLSLACDIDLKALCYKPFTLLPDAGGKCLLHDHGLQSWHKRAIVLAQFYPIRCLSRIGSIAPSARYDRGCAWR